MQRKHIILIGFPGSGKTTLGVALADLLKMPFIDTDNYISEKAGCSIPDIFKNEGEEAFRRKEKEALEEILKTSPQVISTGGGMPCFFNNMELMKSAGITVYLEAKPEQLCEWLHKSSGNRPLTANKSKEELLNFITTSLETRSVYYEQAYLFLPAHGADVHTLAVILKQELNRILCKEGEEEDKVTV